MSATQKCALSAALDVLCPMHLRVSASGHIRHVGPTMCKLRPEARFVGARFLEIFQLLRPRNLSSVSELMASDQAKLHLKFRDAPLTTLNGVALSDPQGDGALINLSFGISILDAVREYALTSSDFAATDLAIEMLFLVEAKTAAMDASRKLNLRLQSAKIAAEEQAFTDTLTGLKNRRAVDHILSRLTSDSQGFWLMQMDLDFFKAVNDRFGHAAGDFVLQHVAKILLEETRDQDDTARIGGDEFVLVFRGDIPKARMSEIAGRIIERIQRPLPYKGNLCNVSASIGINRVVRGEGATADRVLNCADRALYFSKENGRSQFAFYDDIDDRSQGAPMQAKVN